MDKATVLGLVLSAVLILGSMALGGSIMMFVDVQSVLIVFGGTLAATLTKERLPVVMSAITVAKQSFIYRVQEPQEVIEKVIHLAKLARANGVLALDGEKVPTPFMQKGLRLVCDGVTAEEVEVALTTEMDALLRRHRRGRDVWKFVGATAPSMGMVGTLIGLVAMLQKLDNPSAIGPAMAVALLTTMYGAIMAFVIANPIAEKLASRTDEEAVAMEIATRGFVSITKGEKPMLIEEKLNAFLKPSQKAASKDG